MTWMDVRGPSICFESVFRVSCRATCLLTYGVYTSVITPLAHRSSGTTTSARTYTPLVLSSVHLYHLGIGYGSVSSALRMVSLGLSSAFVGVISKHNERKISGDRSEIFH
jgi:hypothetical protein